MGTKWTAAKGGAGCVDQSGITNPRPRVPYLPAGRQVQARPQPLHRLCFKTHRGHGSVMNARDALRELVGEEHQQGREISDLLHHHFLHPPAADGACIYKIQSLCHMQVYFCFFIG